MILKHYLQFASYSLKYSLQFASMPGVRDAIPRALAMTGTLGAILAASLWLLVFAITH